LRAEVAERLGIDVGVIVTDTAGRPWRLGQTDIAIGAAGIDPLQDLRGGVDASGRPLEVTMPAVADAIAAAADLVKGKSTGIPVAVLRGSNLVTAADGPGATALIRPESDDLFRHSGGELPLARRTVRSFRNDAVPQPAIDRAVAAAGTAPAPHHSRPWRFVQCSPATATRLLAALAEAWRADLAGDGFDEESIERRVARGAFLHEVPCLLIPCLVDGAAHDYPDLRRRAAEERMFLLSVGAGIQNLLLSLTDDGLGSAWVSSTLFAPDVARAALDLPTDHQPMGAIAIGYPLTRTPPRPDPDGSDLLLRR
jgi:coenzyme F420-0:L-glutamate ligase/coenzyme F420-1:gamma-L-glutamate ligase